MQIAVYLSYSRYIGLTRLLRPFSGAFQLVQNINSKAANRVIAFARSTSGVTHLSNAVLYSAEKHDVLLYIEAADANTLGPKVDPLLHWTLVLSLCRIPSEKPLKNKNPALRVKKFPQLLTGFYSLGFC